MRLVTNLMFFVMGLIWGTILFMYVAHAGTFVNLGVGVPESDKGKLGEVQFFNAGYRTEIGPILSWQTDVGGWSDLSRRGGKSSYFLSSMVGVEARPTDAVIRAMTGLAAITNPDIYLGGHLTFTHEIFIGVRDSGGTSFGAFFRHFSTGGLFPPDVGRNIFGLKAEIPL